MPPMLTNAAIITVKPGQPKAWDVQLVMGRSTIPMTHITGMKTARQSA
jgi:hypothetical protein